MDNNAVDLFNAIFKRLLKITNFTVSSKHDRSAFMISTDDKQI